MTIQLAGKLGAKEHWESDAIPQHLRVEEANGIRRWIFCPRLLTMMAGGIVVVAVVIVGIDSALTNKFVEILSMLQINAPEECVSASVACASPTTMDFTLSMGGGAAARTASKCVVIAPPTPNGGVHGSFCSLPTTHSPSSSSPVQPTYPTAIVVCVTQDAGPRVIEPALCSTSHLVVVRLVRPADYHAIPQWSPSPIQDEKSEQTPPSAVVKTSSAPDHD